MHGQLITKYQLRKLSVDDLDTVFDFSRGIYESSDKYPDFTLSPLNLADDSIKQQQRREFFQSFLMPSEFNNYSIRQCYAMTDASGRILTIVGIRRWSHMPSWSISWLLSRDAGLRFINTFRHNVRLLCELNEQISCNEFYVTYPASREEAYSRIMMEFRKRYYTFVETTIPAGERSPYSFIHKLLGGQLYSHDMTVRRYILRRPDTEYRE